MSPVIQTIKREVLPTGCRLGPYEIIRLAGSGAFAQVYLARQMTLDVNVALKVIQAAKSAEREIQGARIMTMLRHVNLVSVLHAEWIGDQLVIAMDWVEGQTLAERLTVTPAIEPNEALRIASEVVRGLAEIHNVRLEGCARIAHLDLKPANILIQSDGRIKITDFGISQLLGSVGPRSATEGSPLWMAPEQFEGTPDQSSDLWALGALLYRMLAGHGLFGSPTLDEYPMAIAEMSRDISARLKAVPDRFRPIIGRCMMVSPSDRVLSAQALLTELMKLREPAEEVKCPKCGTRLPTGGECPDCTVSVLKPVVTKLPALRAPSPLRHRMHLVGTVALLFLLVVGGGFAWHYWGRTPSFPRVLSLKRPDATELQRIRFLEKSVEGKPVDRMRAMEAYISAHPDDPATPELQGHLAVWRRDNDVIAAAEAFGSRPGVRMSQVLGGWVDASIAVHTPLGKDYASKQAAKWRERLDHYAGYALLRVISAAGIPPVRRPILGATLSSTYFTVSQDDKEIYRSRTIKSTSMPAWGEAVRIAVGVEHKNLLRIFASGLLSDTALFEQPILKLPPDGQFQISGGTIVVDLTVQREE
jgi:hypothetical protein